MNESVLGGVNLRADEEANEITDQLTTMETERDDLIEAIKKLRHGHLQPQQGSARPSAFLLRCGQQHFKSLFAKLFGGGEAELTLTDADDPLLAALISSPARRAKNPRP